MLPWFSWHMKYWRPICKEKHVIYVFSTHSQKDLMQRTHFTESVHLNSPNTENGIFYIQKEAYFYKHFYMKSHIVKKGPVIILDVNLLFWLLSQNTVVPFPWGQETHSKALNEEFHCTSPNVLGEEVMQVLLLASLGWGQLPRHLLEYYLYRLVLLFEMSRLTSDSPLAGRTREKARSSTLPPRVNTST